MSKLLTIISDCQDDNTRARQEIRYQALLGDITPSFVGVNTDLEAQGDLIDAIDAHKDAPGIIVVNVAPRGNKEKYPNGIPFCFHTFGKLTIIGTPNCFALAKKLGFFTKTFETDVLTVCEKFLPEDEAKRISQSQFRSYEYLPYLAKWISEGKEFPFKEIEINDFPEDNFVWRVDSFGNCKTTLVDYDAETDKRMLDYKFFERLADVPKDGAPYFTRGSSGYKDKRFLEIVIQKDSVSEKLGLKVGSPV